ncbi:MAG: bifunctional 5,10-methylene-tetrahydrofolate dehydrogenase/5,10-methylene-tetrahydrofolate cyclohydrolase, partial [Chlamydiae bacterium RIFCSPHIGHO2_12_FULL_49_9]
MIIDGKEIAAEIQKTVREKILNLKKRKVGLAFLLVGSHPASQSYVRGKQKACVATGIESTLVELPEDTSQKELLKQIDKLNQNDAIDGILVQLPLPPQIDPKIITSAIDPEKDVDGFHPMNVGKMLLGEEGGFLPCTPHGIQVMLEKSHTPVEGKHVVILGRSNLVGKPLAAILMQKRKGCNATVTVAHGKSEKLPEITRSADIL